MGELIDLGVKAGIVEKSGAWISYGGTRIGQGKGNAKQYLRENPLMAVAIEKAVRQNAGLIVDRMLAAPEPGEADETEDPAVMMAESAVEDTGLGARKGGRPKR